MRVFENRMLSRIFGPKGDQVTGFHNLYFSRNIRDNTIKKDEMGWACSSHGTVEKFV
jgi:hypothetical protein